MPEMWLRVPRISLMRAQVRRIRMAQGELFPPFVYDYAKPRRSLLGRSRKNYLSLGSYQVFSLVNVPPGTFH